MGNFISCTLPHFTSKSTAKVILPGGEMHRFDDIVNAAELMLDFPEHVVVNSSSMHVGRRLSPLAADEALKKGNLYVMFPMRRNGSRVTAADLGWMFVAVKKKKSRCSGRILPEMSPPPPAVAERLGDVFCRDIRNRLSIGRSKRPLLETIEEEDISCRFETLSFECFSMTK